MTYNGAGHGFEGDENGPPYYVTTNNGFRLWEVVKLSDRGDNYQLHNIDPAAGIEWALKSLVMAYRWNNGTNHAEHIRATYVPPTMQPRHFPSTGCSCGFYAYYNRDKFWSSHSDFGATPRVWGLMEGWGRCVVGNDGFRSEFALVSAFVVAPDGKDQLPLPWLNRHNLTPEAGAKLLRHVLEMMFPTTPIFPSTDDMLRVIPLHGRPR